MMTKDEMQYIIDYEIIVDCYDDYEVAMGWHIYLEETLNFPFEAEVKLKKKGGTSTLTKVEVLGVASEEGGSENPEIDVEVSAKDSDFVMEVPISRLQNIKADEETLTAFKIWTFWNS